MNTNLHKWFMEPRKARNTRKKAVLLSRLSRVSWLKNNSALSTHHSELGAAIMAEKLKEIQR